ncbi:glycoside hydrolase family 97 catalytic domain-containing protein [Kribbella sp. CA-293567]|uniref:glycoside hydrolase family 97 catalytic domain-containing protein n=1 Tax=Kribbella sp. CA-293567 TaxID=3002436 RepID=UPI0022DDD27A|nr:glycoside hydrolase family 97 catalytic domain-containing protein [Kribbella sp. CA-293567]WBQ02108.1 glycoside hydrolase family 97 catalytic domain-containing protein [Kribbella sp. CA-293567]
MTTESAEPRGRRAGLLALAAAVLFSGAIVVVPASAEGSAEGPVSGQLTEVAGDGVQVVESPDGDLRVAVASEGGRLTYSVSNGSKVLVGASGLGVELAGRPSLTQGMTIESVERRAIDETWTPVWGTSSKIRNHASELTVHATQAGTDFKLDLVFRVFDDGVGFRYRFPDQPGLDSYTVTAEQTEFALAPAARSWSIPAGKTWSADEQHYRDLPLTGVATAQTPITVLPAADSYLVVHEADLTDYPSMTLKSVPGKPGRFFSDLIALPDGTKAKLSGEFSTPWRTLTVGERPGDLGESHLIENLNDPCAICADTSWIKPATYVGVWWELQRRATTWTAGPKHGATTAQVKQYIDLAKDAGAEFVLAEGWNTNAGGSWAGQDFLTPQTDFDLPEVLRYAEANGVGYIAHNETRGDIDYYDRNLEKIFSRYEALGIHAIKTGYATKFLLGGVNRSHYDQEAVRHYQRVTEAAARHRITVDAHEAIKPTGLARTYPNLMTGEGVAGMEMQNYMGANGNPPAQATILPFTRFMGGPADYTPGVLDVTWDPARLGTRVQTTSAAQLALYPTFFSPLQMLADTPENYAAHPGFAFLKNLPTTWDETRVLDSVIGDHTTTARRSGDTWYLGAVTDENSRSLRVPLSFLSPGAYVAESYADAQQTSWKGDPKPIEIRKTLVRSSTLLNMSLVGAGGQAVRLKPATAADLGELPWYAAPKAQYGTPTAVLNSVTQQLTVKAPLINTGSTVAEFRTQVFLDGRAAGAAQQVRVAGGGTRIAEWVLPASEVSDRDFRVAVGAPTGERGESVLVEQTQSLLELVRELRRTSRLSPSAMATLQPTITKAETVLRAGDVTGRLLALQELRLALYGLPLSDVSAQARTAIDDNLAARLGRPLGLFSLALKVRTATDSGALEPALADRLATEVRSGITAAVANDVVGMRAALNRFTVLVEAGPIPPELAAELLAAGGLFATGPRKLEAESAQLISGACLRTDHPGYTGTGFVACLKTKASGVRFTAPVAADGLFVVRLRYANGMGATQTMTLSSGTRSTRLQLPALANWDVWSDHQVSLPLSQAAPLDFVFGPDDNGNVNLDSISLEPDPGVIHRQQ